MSKALVLSLWNVSEPASGGGRRIQALLDALRGQALLCQPAPIHPTCETVAYGMDFGRKKRGINWGIFNFFWPPTIRIVHRLVAERRPPVVVLTSMWNYAAVRGLKGIPIVLDTHDVNAVAVGERMGARHPFTRLVQAWESYTARRMSHVFVCSTHDREQFMALYGIEPARITVAPNGVNVPPRPAKRTPAAGQPLTLFFMGKLDYQPNREALEFLDAVVMPALEQQGPGRFRLIVTGGPAPTRPFHPAITFLGVLTTQELQRALGGADICLAPIFSGSGTRLKIIEFLAAAKPVVATPKGAEGLGCVSGEHLLLADPADFAPAILRLADDRDLRMRLGESGWEMVKREFDWANVAQVRWQSVLRPWVPGCIAGQESP